MKKFLSVILIMTIIFGSVATVAYALETVQNNNDDASEEVVDVLVSTPCDAEETTEAPAEQKSDKVARLYICIAGLPDFSNGFFLGHAALCFENLSDETLRVGFYDLPPGQGVTVETTNSRNPFYGSVLYNYWGNSEAKRNKSLADGKNIRYMSTDLTQSELDRASAMIRSTNEWTPISNCVWFAVKVWNVTNPPYPMVFLLAPIVDWLMIPTQSEPLYAYKAEWWQVYDTVGFGDNAELKVKNFEGSQEELEEKLSIFPQPFLNR